MLGCGLVNDRSMAKVDLSLDNLTKDSFVDIFDFKV